MQQKRRKNKIDIEGTEVYNFLSCKGEKYPLSDNGRIGKCVGTTSAPTSSGRSIAVRVATSYHRWYTNPSGEDDPGPTQSFYTINAEVFNRERKARMGAGIHPTAVVAEGVAMGKCKNGCSL
jgi:hypothetical protein